MICLREVNTTIIKLVGLLSLAAVSGKLLANPTVEVRQTVDYLAISFEAEDFESADDRWVLTDPTTPAVDPSMDPDPNHSDLAVGNTYLELLPDYRVHEDDPFVGPNGERGLWNTPGEGPLLTYSIDFPEAGRYYVHARALSTGKEDNGMHVGLNGEWPDSGARHQFCTAGAGWKWSSRQRYSGGEGDPCGVDYTIWVTVDTPGAHTFSVSAREDGYELDRLMLIKDKSNNTRTCRAHSENSIACRDGSLEESDEVADLTVALTTSATDMQIGDTIELSAGVENLDAHDEADDVQLVLDLGLGSRWELIGTPAQGCQVIETDVVCNHNQLGTSPPEDQVQYTFTLKPLMSGESGITATVSMVTPDTNHDNNAQSITVSVSDEGSLSRLGAQFSSAQAEWEQDETGVIVAQIENFGAGQAHDATLALTLADGLGISILPADCGGVSQIVCDAGELAVGESFARTFFVTGSEAGLYSISLSASATNLDGAEPLVTHIASVMPVQTDEPAEPAPAPNPAPDPDSGSVPDSETVAESESDRETDSEADTRAGSENQAAGLGALGLWLVLAGTGLLLSRAFATGPLGSIRFPAACPTPPSVLKTRRAASRRPASGRV